MNKSILIQCRLSSSRFPEKMLAGIADYSLVEYVYHRCRESKIADKIAIITSDDVSDNQLYELCINKGIPVFRGDLNNVLKRYIDASDFFNAKLICRVCGDSPFVDITAIDEMLAKCELESNIDYMVTKNSLNGFTSEVFHKKTLKQIQSKNLTQADREHVTQYIRQNKKDFVVKEVDLNMNPDDLSGFSLTVDYPADLIIANKVANYLHGFNFTSHQVIDAIRMEYKHDLHST